MKKFEIVVDEPFFIFITQDGAMVFEYASDLVRELEAQLEKAEEK